MRHASKAIVLSVEKFGEADCYVRFLTQKWGVISTLAKSARKSKKRYVGGLDLFCHDEIFLRGDPKDRPYLLELDVINSFPGIREHLDKLMIAGKAVQWIKKLADVPTPMPQLYSLLGQTLALIEQENDLERLELLTLVFKLKLLGVLGLSPQVDKCTRCEGPLDPTTRFDLNAGGAVCNQCPKESLSSHLFLETEQRVILKNAEQLKLATWAGFTPDLFQVLPLTRLLTQFASFHTHMKLPI
ncbi:DNA repair protein RecO [bacterium]|nr:DNA repair protein RecO [bacterium]